jgi:uncharacterized OB-fold protein
MAENKPDTQAKELISLQILPSLDCRFATGPIMGKWFHGLKEKKFYATKCPKCGRTQAPPSEACAECVVRTPEFVEVGPKGTVLNFDTSYYASPDPLTGKVRSTPYTTLYFKLDGTTPEDAFNFDLKAEDIPRIKIGSRLRPVWNEVRTGSVNDLLYFEIDD